MSKGYNGHPSYNAWNVSLWINNDERFYYAARNMVGRFSSKDEAAVKLLDVLPSHTPDGVRFTKTNVRRAISDI